MMRRNPLVTATAVLALALGIGANAAVFSVIDAILLRQIELPHAEQLGVIWKGPLHGEPESGMAPANAFELGNRLRTASIAAFANTEFIVQQGTDGEHVSSMRVAWNFFSTLKIAPAIGRDFLQSDDSPVPNALLFSDTTCGSAGSAATPGLSGRRSALAAGLILWSA